MSFLFCYLHVWTDSTYKLCAIKVLKLNKLWFSRNSPGLSNIQSPRGTVTLSVTAWINLVFIFVAKRKREFNQFVLNFYRRQWSCGQGNIFTPVCHSVHRGGVCLSACWDTTYPPSRHPSPPPPGVDTPREADTPRSRHPPGADTAREADTPGSRHPPWEQTPPESSSPPGADSGIRSMSGRYASYWNVFLYKIIFLKIHRTCRLLGKKIFGICSFLSSNWNSSMPKECHRKLCVNVLGTDICLLID